jgi:D-sedoheptulose 7-phosphate isomerase
MNQLIRESVEQSIALKRSFFGANELLLVALAREITKALESGGKVLLFGNGGSAADAQHIAAELVGRFRRERRPLAAIAITTDTSILTGVSNDYGYEQVFARQVSALGRPGDVAIGISTSGNSPSVVEAVTVARNLGLVTAALTGRDGGRLGAAVHFHLNVPHEFTDRVQEVHIMIGHILCQLVEESLKGP